MADNREKFTFTTIYDLVFQVALPLHVFWSKLDMSCHTPSTTFLFILSPK